MTPLKQQNTPPILTAQHAIRGLYGPIHSSAVRRHGPQYEHDGGPRGDGGSKCNETRNWRKGCLVGRFTENGMERDSMSLVVFEFLWSGFDEHREETTDGTRSHHLRLTGDGALEVLTAETFQPLGSDTTSTAYEQLVSPDISCTVLSGDTDQNEVSLVLRGQATPCVVVAILFKHLDGTSSFKIDISLGFKGRIQHGRRFLKFTRGQSSVDFRVEHDTESASPLHWAAGNGWTKAVETLLKDGRTNWNPRDAHKRTPLSWAAENGQTDTARLLLDHGHEQSGSDLLLVNFDEEDESGETSLDWAVKNKHDCVLRLLVKSELRVGGEEEDLSCAESSSWSPAYLRAAARVGWVALTRLVLKFNASIDIAAKNRSLLEAIIGRHGRVVHMLLIAGAEADLVTSQVQVNDPGIMSMIEHFYEDGRLTATQGEAEDRTAATYPATVADSVQESGTRRCKIQQVSVKDILEDPTVRPAVGELVGMPSFTWIHLPANNMRWVEILLAKLYKDSSVTYRIFSPEPWVRQQHLGINDAAHARFMRPLCQIFSTILDPKAHLATSALRAAPTPADSSLVLFMPFLTWELEERSQERHQAAMGGSSTSTPSTGVTGEKLLLDNYLGLSHPIHIRRTLGQYYYHALRDTSEQDRNQTYRDIKTT